MFADVQSGRKTERRLNEDEREHESSPVRIEEGLSEIVNSDMRIDPIMLSCHLDCWPDESQAAA